MKSKLYSWLFRIFLELCKQTVIQINFSIPLPPSNTITQRKGGGGKENVTKHTDT